MPRQTAALNAILVRIRPLAAGSSAHGGGRFTQCRRRCPGTERLVHARHSGLWGLVAALLGFMPYIGPLTIAGLLLLAGLPSADCMPDMPAPAAVYLCIHALQSARGRRRCALCCACHPG